MLTDATLLAANLSDGEFIGLLCIGLLIMFACGFGAGYLTREANEAKVRP